MKRVLFMMLATAMFVACGQQKGAADVEMNNYKAEWSEITSLLDVAVVEAEGFDAWYDTLTNSEVRDVNAAAETLGESFAAAEHWYKNLSDADQKVARATAEAWEQENPVLQLQVELFAVNMLGIDLTAKDVMPLIKVSAPVVVEEAAEVETVEETTVEEVVEPEIIAE